MTIEVKPGFESWLVNQACSIAKQMVIRKLDFKAHEWLVNSKLTTKNLAWPLHKDLPKFMKIILANLRKGIPLLKVEEAYSKSFCTFFTRHQHLRIIVEETYPGATHKYLSRIGVLTYIEDYSVPIDLHTNSEEGECTITVSGVQWSHWDNLRVFYFIFQIPAVIGILSTLHRKALFTNGTEDNSEITW